MDLFKEFNPNGAVAKFALHRDEAMSFMLDHSTGRQIVEYFIHISEKIEPTLDKLHPETKHLPVLAKYFTHGKEFAVTLQIPIDMPDGETNTTNRVSILAVHHTPSLELEIAKNPHALVPPLAMLGLLLNLEDRKIAQYKEVQGLVPTKFEPADTTKLN